MTTLKHKNIWEIETRGYLPRISGALDRLASLEKANKDFFPGPFERQLSRDESIVHMAALFAINTQVSVDQLFDNVRLLWSQGQMVGVTSLVRFSVEYWGALALMNRTYKNYIITGDYDVAASRLERLMLSGKSKMALPWGGETESEPYSVMKFIDEIERRESSIKDDYAFLSEGAHPSFLQNTYFIMASRQYHNFKNDEFRKHSNTLLERTCTIIEKTSKGIIIDAMDIWDSTQPILDKLKNQNK